MDGEAARLNPFAPSHQPPPRALRRRRCLYASLCCVSVLVLVVVIIVILAFTVFRPRDPTITVSSIAIEGVSPSLTFPLSSVQLNLTLLIGARVYNPNRVSFSHASGTVLVSYKGVQIGDADVEEGKIPSRGSEDVNTTLTLTMQSFAQVNLTAQLIRDVRGGEVGMDSKARIPGRITLLGFIKKHIVAISDCYFIVGFPSLDVKIQECSTKAKI